VNDPAPSTTAETPAPAPESATAPDFKRKAVALKFHLVLLAIVVVTVLLRILMSLQVVATDPFAYAPPDVTDMATYHELSRAILRGHRLAEYAQRGEHASCSSEMARPQPHALLPWPCSLRAWL
jgi:hypothetical protein